MTAKTPSPLPRGTTFVSPATTTTPAASAARAAPRTQVSRSSPSTPFLEDQRPGQPERSGTAHGEVVDRTEDRETAEITAGENRRVDNERIGGQGWPSGRHFGQHRGVGKGFQVGIAESRQKELLHQLARQPASPTVGKKNPFGSLHEPASDAQRSWRYQAAQVPSEETMQAPTGRVRVAAGIEERTLRRVDHSRAGRPRSGNPPARTDRADPL